MLPMAFFLNFDLFDFNDVHNLNFKFNKKKFRNQKEK